MSSPPAKVILRHSRPWLVPRTSPWRPPSHNLVFHSERVHPQTPTMSASSFLKNPHLLRNPRRKLRLHRPSRYLTIAPTLIPHAGLGPRVAGASTIVPTLPDGGSRPPFHPRGAVTFAPLGRAIPTTMCGSSSEVEGTRSPPSRLVSAPYS